MLYNIDMKLVFESILKAPPEDVWIWAVTGKGINRELFPILRMSSLAKFDAGNIDKVVLGEPITKSWLFLFGIIPIDCSNIILVELYPGKGFVEESKMLSMKLWRHERTIKLHSSGSIIEDKLTFEPRFFSSFCRWFIELIFKNRHTVLVGKFG